MYHQHLYYFGRYEETNKRAYSFNFDFWKGLAIFSFFAWEATHNFWAAWFILFISQWCGIVTVVQNVADRYCSLPAIGVMMVLVKYVSMLDYTYQIIIYSVIITYYLMRYSRLFRAYKSIPEFFQYHIEIQPDDVEARTLWCHRVAKKDPYKAFMLIKDGLVYRPKDFKLLMCFAQCFFIMGMTENGLKILNVAEQNVPLGEEADAKKYFDEIRAGIKVPVNLNREQRRKRGL
jgi:hypothetical protein